MKNINVSELINDYVNGNMGVCQLCSKYHIGKVKAKNFLKANGVEMKKRGGQKVDEHFVVPDFHIKKYNDEEGFHYMAVDEKTGFSTNDYMNNGGHLTSYISKEYGVKIPTLYDRRLYYMRTGDYWWEQWLKTIKVKNEDVKKCPYCGWETKDIENKSGAFEVHLLRAHNMSKIQYLQEHPEDRHYFILANTTNNLQMETDLNKFVTCKICGKKMTRITDVHLKKHGITKGEYMDMFSLSSTTCNSLHQRMSEITKETNANVVRSFTSRQEIEISDYIRSLGFECECNRKILNGKEIDIFIPSVRIGIEFNGNLWHSEKYGKDRMYHLNKLNECNRNGVELLQIFEDEYNDKKEIVFSKIRHLLKCDEPCCKIPARKCQIQEIYKSDAESFLEENHIQGFSNSTLYIGAIFEGKLVGVMSFLNENEGRWNLTRFASLNGYICQGVAGKIFEYFVRNYSPSYVRSFADRRWTTNKDSNLYTKIGFKLDEILKPDYRYYNQKVDRFKRFHKFGFRKSTLHNKYDLPMHMTEKEMTEALGYTRIWDCGLYKYVWRASEQ